MRSSTVRLAQSFVNRAKSIRSDHFDYVLPASRIAYRPLQDRSASKLLVVSGSPPTTTDHHFFQLPDVLPREALVVLNSSRVIPARLIMQRRSGARVEVMLLSPSADQDPVNALTTESWNTKWKCFLGGRRVKLGETLISDLPKNSDTPELASLSLAGYIHEKCGSIGEISFSLQRNPGLSHLVPDLSLKDVINRIGHTPLPPYIKRNDDASDKESYQTVYADVDGSVAAPTAGLHMTEAVMKQIVKKGAQFANVTLHVGAGTFAPLGGESAGDHEMHNERISVLKEDIGKILLQLQSKKLVVAMGTTSVRTLESLYWIGVQLLLSSAKCTNIFVVGQWEPYEWLDAVGSHKLPSAVQAYEAVKEFIESQGEMLVAQTKLLIVPGYPFKIVNALITNFHQPRSTLLMLVSAFLGGEPTTLLDIYASAIQKDYRFLSYGDSSLYLPSH